MVNPALIEPPVCREKPVNIDRLVFYHYLSLSITSPGTLTIASIYAHVV